MTTHNNLPGGFSKITTIVRTVQEEALDQLAAIARGAANLARLGELMKKSKEGGVAGVSHDLRGGQAGNGRVK